MGSQMINIVVVDDHEIIREGLVQLLQKNSHIKVIGQAENGMEAVKLCCELKPDIIIMDIGMPLLNGIDAARQILARNSGRTKVIILSMYADDDTVMRSIETGVSGFILKTGASKELLEAVFIVEKNETYLTPQVSSKVMSHIQSKTKTKEGKSGGLTSKEKHVLQLIAEGRSTKDIAKILNVSFHTAKTHRNNLMRKLNLHSVASLTQYSIENKLISSNKP
jgi:DNA-binding NarL/FixJ family response regulator